MLLLLIEPLLDHREKFGSCGPFALGDHLGFDEQVGARCCELGQQVEGNFPILEDYIANKLFVTLVNHKLSTDRFPLFCHGAVLRMLLGF